MLKRVFALLLLAAAATGLSGAPAAAQSGGALIYGSDALTSPNAVSLPTTTNGWFNEGGSGVNGTQVTDYWLNKVGGELSSAITAAPCSATINMSAYNQLSACLQALVPTFTPVQQGGGLGQGTNKLYLGWDNAVARLRLAVDGSDQGDLVLAKTLNLPQAAAHVSTTAQGVTMTPGVPITVTAAFTPTQNGFCLVSGFGNQDLDPVGGPTFMQLSAGPGAEPSSTDSTYGASQFHQIVVSVTAGTTYTFTFTATASSVSTNTLTITARVSYIFVGTGSF
jgi:hypothetical protein